MRWRFCQRIEQPAERSEALRTEPARHPIPRGDALLDKRNTSYRWHPLCYTCGTLTGALSPRSTSELRSERKAQFIAGRRIAPSAPWRQPGEPKTRERLLRMRNAARPWACPGVQEMAARRPAPWGGKGNSYSSNFSPPPPSRYRSLPPAAPRAPSESPPRCCWSLSSPHRPPRRR